MLRKTISKKSIKNKSKKPIKSHSKQIMKGYNTFDIYEHDKIDFGLHDFNGGKRYRVIIDIELRPFELYSGAIGKHFTKIEGDNGIEFAAMGELTYRNRFAQGGQCLDYIYEESDLKHNALFKEIYELWRKYHLKNLDTVKDEKIINRIMKLFQ